MHSKRIIPCRHKDYAHLNIGVDFSELWDGAPENNQKSRGNWLGALKGRPLLADQLFPTIHALTHSDKPRVIKSRLSALRTLFRFLDAYEKWCEQQNTLILATEIKTLEDIATHHLQMWKTPSPTEGWQQPSWATYQAATQFLKEAAGRLCLTHLMIPSYARNKDIDRSDILDESIGNALIKALAKKANEIWAHWERSDLLAAKGRNFIGIERTPIYLRGHDTGNTTIVAEGGITEADLHATYRAAVAANNQLPLSRIQFLRVWGYHEVPTPNWWPSYRSDHPNAGMKIRIEDIQAGLYPTSDQLAILFLLFLARTGWNPSTALSLDITNEENWCKEYTEKYVWLFAYKPRSREWQDTVAIKNQRTGSYQIIMRLLARTEILRRAIEADPSLCTNINIARRSPWLYQRTIQKDKTPVHVELSTLLQGGALQRVITSYNQRQTESKRHIPPTTTPTDLRDIFAAATYANSGFSLFLTQLALGHKKSTTTFNYLRRRAWRAESENKKNEMFVALIDQVETHRVIDLTLLRAKMDGTQVTEAQIARLNVYRKYRTYVGMGCSDPTYPPAYIDSTNPRDGTMACIQGHLCAGCPKGRVFNDSLSGLTRRCAELEWLQDTLPVEVFQDSSLADQMLVLRATLTQWPAKAVDEHLAQWAMKIKSGEHQPIRFSGEH